MKKILITNDDGIGSDGILRLAGIAKEFGEVWIVAPDSQRSAMSHSINFHDSVEVWPVEFGLEGVHAYACSGTPADCAKIGILNIVPGGPDHVFSGINNGLNVASDLQYSATVGAALEAAFLKKHAAAFSEEAIDQHEVTDRYIREITEKLLNSPLGPNEIWNVNFPCCKAEECKGILYERTVSSDNYYNDSYVVTEMPDGKLSFKVNAERNWKAAKGTDLKAVIDKYVSVGIVRNLM